MDCETVERENIPERYLAGTLDPQLKEQWELHYFGCEHCSELLATWQAIDQPLRGMAPSIRQEIRPRRSAARWLWAGAAIAAALVVGVLTRPAPPKPETVVRTARAVNPWAELARIDPPAYQPSTLRAAGTKAEVQFQTAMESYARLDYAHAITGLEAALALDPSAAAPRFFLGACHLLTGDAARAVADLETVAAGDSPFAPEAQYDLAKAYLLQGDKHRAIVTLQRLADSPGDFREAARQLRTRLNPLQ
jgi:tetratricopeptide (TPR) repeat protein